MHERSALFEGRNRINNGRQRLPVNFHVLQSVFSLKHRLCDNCNNWLSLPTRYVMSQWRLRRRNMFWCVLDYGVHRPANRTQLPCSSYKDDAGRCGCLFSIDPEYTCMSVRTAQKDDVCHMGKC